MARDAKEALGKLRRYENCLSPESKETRSPKGYESAGGLLSIPRNSVFETGLVPPESMRWARSMRHAIYVKRSASAAAWAIEPQTRDKQRQARTPRRLAKSAVPTRVRTLARLGAVAG